MENKKEKKDNRKKEDCPLCEPAKKAVKNLNLYNQPSIKKDAQTEKDEFIRIFKTVFILIIIIFVAYAVYTSWASAPQAQVDNNFEKEGSLLNTGLAPDFYAFDIYGNGFSLSDFKNKKPVLLVFWATWCRFCLEELPDLMAFAQENESKIKVFAIASGENKDPVEEYIKEHDVNFTMLLDNTRDIWNLYKARGTPLHFLIAKDGKIINIRPGLATMADLKAILSML